MNRTVSLTTALVAVALPLMPAAATPATVAPAAPQRAMLIVATHTDDESTALPLYTGPGYAGVRRYILWIDETRGGSNTQLVNGLPERWNYPEWKPAGNLTTDKARSDGKYEGSLLNLAAIRKADPGLPALTYDKPTKKFTNSGRAVTTWIDPARGGAIRYSLPQANVNALNVRAAINDVTKNSSKYGIPAGLTWTDIVSASYYKYSSTPGGSRCDDYSNPTHRQVHDGIVTYSYPQFKGWKHFAVCSMDSRKARSKKLTPAVRAVTHASRGSLNTYFGWLYRKYGVPLMTGKNGVFSDTMAYTVSVATVGKK